MSALTSETKCSALLNCAQITTFECDYAIMHPKVHTHLTEQFDYELEECKYII